MKKASSQEYDELNIDDRREPANVGVVYRDLDRNTQDTAGMHFVVVIALPLGDT